MVLNIVQVVNKEELNTSPAREIYIGMPKDVENLCTM